MGSYFSQYQEAEKIVHAEDSVKKVAKEILKDAEEVIERVVVDVAVVEIEKKIMFGSKKPRLESIKEEKPLNPSPTHFSNLHCEVAQEILEDKPLKEYKESELKKFENLHSKNKRRFAFFV